MRNVLPMTILIVYACSGAAALVAGEIYKWTDEHGNVHFGDRPPVDNAEEIRIRSNAPATAPPDNSDWRARQEKLLNAFEEERDLDAQAREKKRKQREQLARDCAAARKRLQEYTTARYLYEQDSAGKEMILSKEQRTRAEQELRDQITEHCK
ncbi:MAG: DUF4124 domain-containing protein [Pseudomonadota bacterium]|nr:MAG: DUF4124 domain-containing protein [Pseudomonadota bacterium]